MDTSNTPTPETPRVHALHARLMTVENVGSVESYQRMALLAERMERELASADAEIARMKGKGSEDPLPPGPVAEALALVGLQHGRNPQADTLASAVRQLHYSLRRIKEVPHDPTAPEVERRAIHDIVDAAIAILTGRTDKE